MTPDPRSRATALLLALIATFIATDGTAMLIVWLVVCLPTMIVAKILRAHLLFVTVFLLPFAFAVFLVWVILVGAPPGAASGSDLAGAIDYAMRITFRLALIGAIFQMCFLTIPPAELPSTLSRCGIKGDLLVIALGALALIPELNRRADQVLAAMLARGLIPKRSFVARAIRLPRLLRPLFAWALRSSLQRSDVWQQRRMLERLNQLSTLQKTGTLLGSISWISISSAWLLYNVA